MIIRSAVLTVGHYEQELCELFGDVDFCIWSIKEIVDRSLPGSLVWDPVAGTVCSAGKIRMSLGDVELLIERSISKLAAMYYE